MRRLLLIIPVLLIAAFVGWVVVRRSEPPKIPFARVARETLTSTLTTNGSAEPVTWVIVHAEREGLVQKVGVVEGQRIAQGAPLVELDSADARAELVAAEAREAQAKATLETLEQGGKAAELTEIDGLISRLRLENDHAKKDYESLNRLAAKQAATPQQVAEARSVVESTDIQIRTLEKKRKELASRQDISAVQASLRDALAAQTLAREHLAQGIIRAPIGGIVYHLVAHLGSYLKTGDEVASVGELKQMRVTLYVDEPEMGRVSKGMPVKLTWDALPGHVWQGVVDRPPTEVVALGTRQVGKVICIVQNPGLDLLPGTNVNAEIQSKVVPNALTIPREALRTAANQPGVFLLQGDRVAWRPITTGVATAIKVQVASGLSDGDSVALATDYALKDGARVTPLISH